MADKNATIQRPPSHECCRRTKRLAMSLLLLLYLSGSISPRYSTEARAVPGTTHEEASEGRPAIAESLIGSRPPSCDGMCKGCGRRCMAVQVPVTPQSLAYARGDDISNYKPMTWKCRCGGDIYFNP